MSAFVNHGRFLQLSLLLTALFFLFYIAPDETMAEEVPQHLNSDAVVLSKSLKPIDEKTMTYLFAEGDQLVKVWVFFSDKGITDKSGFDGLAASVVLSDKVLKRRAKVGKAEVVFADLPVVETYISAVTDLGATFRRASRWLNAASFEIPLSQLTKIADLPFVVSVKPMVGFKRTPEIPEQELIVPDEGSFREPDVLNYGASQTQLEQINVPQAHNLGYTGQGVTLCITDTGFRKTHESFAQHYTEGRVLAEYDFVFNDNETSNEPEDVSSQWNHGTYIWSVSGGYKDGAIYGPAYNAYFLLAKTEDVGSETPVEEDNWVAALEWADSLGADVITTSLGYSDWYNQWDYNGATATITIAANTCAGLGIVLCNSMGNSGPGATSLSAPADAFDILAVGAVNSSGVLASFSSRGPTWDGRTKPEVCAMGVSTAAASTATNSSYTAVNGTSLSTPLVAGAACLLIEARPTFSPQLIRLALMETADNAATPNNDYGWGIINAEAALGWGANFTADTVLGNAPLDIQFTDLSSLSTSTWEWSFGDGDSSTAQNPSHTYTVPGVYDVSLTISTTYGDITNQKTAFVVALGDTVTFAADSAFAGHPVSMSVNITNSQPLERIVIPFEHSTATQLVFDSATLGSRTVYFESLDAISWDPWNDKYTFRLLADAGGGAPPLPAGSGEVMKLHFTIPDTVLGNSSFNVDTASVPYTLQVTSPYMVYTPVIYSGAVSSKYILRGDLDLTYSIDIADLLYMVDYSFGSGAEPPALQAYDVNADLAQDIADILYMVEFQFASGPPPPTP